LKYLTRLKGCLLAIPIVNVLGFISQSRYLADGRDLNRFFPGAESGSFASTFASLFMREIVSQSTHGIDLHTGAGHRTNFPQTRITEGNSLVEEMALAFGAPVIMQSKLRDGSLRVAGEKLGKPILVYEAGEALRFDEASIRIGLRGVINTMKFLGMLAHPKSPSTPAAQPVLCTKSQWLRSPVSGMLRNKVQIGAKLEKGQLLGTVSDPFGKNECAIINQKRGYLIGAMQKPLVNEGDGLFHIAFNDRGCDQSVDLIKSLKYSQPAGDTLNASFHPIDPL